jgi:arylsulfatase A-like enzyme
MLTRRTLLQAAASLAIPSRPNILLIMTDQQFAESMSCRIGTRWLRTPNMDSLAAQGTVFTHAYCANPLCVPSRTSIFTGRYPTETGVETNDTTPIDAGRFPNLGLVFRRAGYATGYFGKWHMPFPEGKPEVHGFDTPIAKKQKGDEETAAGAAAFLRAKHDKPFLMVASFLNPHNICQWARDEDLPDGDVGTPPAPAQCPPLRPNHAPQQGEPDILAWMRRSYHASEMFPVGNFDEGKWRQYIWAYYRMIEKVDALIGKVLTALRESGQEERTLVVFTADHGDCQGSHRFNQKTVLYEEAARVPFTLSWKGVTRPGTSDRLVHTGVDLIPTLCDYAGIARPAGLPGLSLKSSPADARRYVVVCNKMVQGAPVEGLTHTPDGRMLRSRRYKYTVYSEGAHREALVDLEKDPGEMVNLAADPKHRATLVEHRSMLAEWCRQTGDKFPQAG